MLGSSGRHPSVVGRRLVVISLVTAGCTAGRSGVGEPQASPAAGCARVGAAGAAYLAIAEAGNRHLEKDFDGLRGRDRSILAAARMDLRDAAATERLFDRRLRYLALPPAVQAVALRLVRLNQDRAALTLRVARATTLAQLRADEPRLTAANAPVEQEVKAIRCQLGLPPPETS